MEKCSARARRYMFSLVHNYKSLILSKLDYGSSVSVAAKHLRRLYPVQSEGLRLATCAFRSNPVVKEFSLSLHRRLINCKVNVFALTPPLHSFSLLRESGGSCDFLVIRWRQSWGYDLCKTCGPDNSQFLLRHWTSLECPVSPSMYASLFLTQVLDSPSAIPWLLLASLSHSVPVYTVRFKSEDRVGCAAVFPHTTLHSSLHRYTPLTVLYIFIECPKFAVHRTHCFPFLPTIRPFSILRDSSPLPPLSLRCLISFLRQTSLISLP